MPRANNAESPLAPGTPFGRHEIVRVLGTGGMGIVYEARHTSLPKRVAVKILHPELAWNEEARQRFLREGELAARIRHNHVVEVHDVGTYDELPFLVMEFLEGEDLAAHLFRRGALPIEEALDILLPVIAGLSAGHSHGIIHRDLKPQNIFLARGGDGELVPKLLDFGVSKLIEERGGGNIRLTQTGSVCGTVQYMSPEQACGALDIGPTSDQYALGAILYECLTGRQAYPGERTLEVLRRVAASSFPPPRQVRPELSVDIERIILRAMQLEPLERFESVIAFGRALLPFASLRSGVLWGQAFAPVRAPAAPLRTAVLPAAGDAAKAAGPTKILPPQPPPATTALTPSAPVAASPPAPPTAVIGAWRRHPVLGIAALGAAAALAVLTLAWPLDGNRPPAIAPARAPSPPPPPPASPSPSPSAPTSAPAEPTAVVLPPPPDPRSPTTAAKRRRPSRPRPSAPAPTIQRTRNQAPLVK